MTSVRSMSLPVIGAALLMLAAGGRFLAQPGVPDLWDWRMPAYVTLAVASSGLWLLACSAVLCGARPSVALVLGVAAALRLIVLTGPVMLSSDIYRYVWDGRVQAAGINPYRYRPADAPLAGLRDEAIFPRINRAVEAPTIYPPAAQVLFAAAYRVVPGVLGMRVLMVGLEVAAIAALWRLLRAAGLPEARLVLYAWAPLPLWEFAGSGHIDAAALSFTALAVLAATWRHRALSGLLLALGVLCKFLPLIVAPALWRRWDLRLPLVLLATSTLLYAPYAWGVGWGVLGFLRGYGAEEGLGNGGGIFWLRAAGLLGALPPWAGAAWIGFAALLLAALALRIAWHPLPDAPGRRGEAIAGGGLVLVMAATLLITPHYPWYFAWIGWFAALRPAGSALLLSALAPLLYLDGAHDRPLWPALVFVPTLLLAVRDIGQALSRPRPRPAPMAAPEGTL